MGNSNIFCTTDTKIIDIHDEWVKKYNPKNNDAYNLKLPPLTNHTIISNNIVIPTIETKGNSRFTSDTVPPFMSSLYLFATLFCAKILYLHSQDIRKHSLYRNHHQFISTIIRT